MYFSKFPKKFLHSLRKIIHNLEKSIIIFFCRHWHLIKLLWSFNNSFQYSLSRWCHFCIFCIIYSVTFLLIILSQFDYKRLVIYCAIRYLFNSHHLFNLFLVWFPVNINGVSVRVYLKIPILSQLIEFNIFAVWMVSAVRQISKFLTSLKETLGPFPRIPEIGRECLSSYGTIFLIFIILSHSVSLYRWWWFNLALTLTQILFPLK